MKYKMSFGESLGQTLIYIALAVLSVTTLYPFINAAALAFNQGYDSLRGGIYLWPRTPTLENFRVMFSNENIGNAAYVSVFRTVVGAALHVLFSAACAFALSYRKLPGRGLITGFLFIPMIFGGGIIPFYILLRDLHLTNSIWVYILPYLFSFYNILILRTYFEGLPEEVKEAAIIDGCGYGRMLVRIIMPLSLPVLATIALYSAVAHWNDWFAGYFYVNNEALQPLQTMLVRFLKENEVTSIFAKLGVSASSTVQTKSYTSESLKMAVLVIVSFPILCVYPFLQKYFIKGALIGAVKS